VWDGVGGVDGLDGASSVAVSPDGADVYVAGRNDDSLAAFSREASTGALTYRGRMVDGVGGIDGLDGARAVAVSPNGNQVYLASQVDHALAVFSRTPSTGILTQVGLHRDGVAGVDGLDTADGLAVSPDGVQVFVSGYGDDSLAVFTRGDLEIFADGFESGATGAWSGAVP
jgi:6-phosphogluconolactonase (cycloisomerase 2 family)